MERVEEKSLNIQNVGEVLEIFGWFEVQLCSYCKELHNGRGLSDALCGSVTG